jgi:hypothetical protein
MANDKGLWFNFCCATIKLNKTNEGYDMRKSTLLKAAILISAFLTAPVFSNVIYNNSGIFNATLDSSVVDDYENSGYTFIQSNAQMTNVLYETSYTTTGFNNLNIVDGEINHFYCAGCNGSFLLDFTATSVSGANGVFGIGFNYFNYGNPLFNALVTYGNGSTEDIALASAFLSNSFWGITSDLEIKSIHFGLANAGATQQGSFGIDNLTIGNARAVPETSTLLLMGLGLIGLSVSRRKKNRLLKLIV